jgi:hypothetical protein
MLRLKPFTTLLFLTYLGSATGQTSVTTPSPSSLKNSTETSSKSSQPSSKDDFISAITLRTTVQPTSSSESIVVLFPTPQAQVQNRDRDRDRSPFSNVNSIDEEREQRERENRNRERERERERERNQFTRFGTATPSTIGGNNDQDTRSSFGRTPNRPQDPFSSFGPTNINRNRNDLNQDPRQRPPENTLGSFTNNQRPQTSVNPGFGNNPFTNFNSRSTVIREP